MNYKDTITLHSEKIHMPIKIFFSVNVELSIIILISVFLQPKALSTFIQNGNCYYIFTLFSSDLRYLVHKGKI